jgi:uncharacterized protein YeaO (DUF488 family)
MIKLKRVYESRGKDDGKKFLVERLWPRGVKKTALADANWLKDGAPSTELRKWFGHDPKKWAEFQHRYQVEMKENEAAFVPILQAARHGTVTLLPRAVAQIPAGEPLQCRQCGSPLSKAGRCENQRCPAYGSMN